MPVFNMGRIKYLIGDAAVPESAGLRFIAHVTNDTGDFTSPSAASLTKRWSKPREEYLRSIHLKQLKLGDVQFTMVQSDTVIVTMVAQHDAPNKCSLDYEALAKCFDKLGEHVKKEGGTIHLPRFSVGIVGASWDLAESIISDKLLKRGLNVTIYDVPAVSKR